VHNGKKEMEIKGSNCPGTARQVYIKEFGSTDPLGEREMKIGTESQVSLVIATGRICKCSVEQTGSPDTVVPLPLKDGRKNMKGKAFPRSQWKR
jgi:hypothetical protein